MCKKTNAKAPQQEENKALAVKCLLKFAKRAHRKPKGPAQTKRAPSKPKALRKPKGPPANQRALRKPKGPPANKRAGHRRSENQQGPQRKPTRAPAKTNKGPSENQQGLPRKPTRVPPRNNKGPNANKKEPHGKASEPAKTGNERKRSCNKGVTKPWPSRCQTCHRNACTECAQKCARIIFQLEKCVRRNIHRDGCCKVLVRCSANKRLSNLPPELGEIVLKKYIAIKTKEKKEMGWDEVHYDIDEAPFCEKLSRIVKIMVCTKCNLSCVNGLCYECYKNGVKHYPRGYPIYDENDYNEIFQKFY